VPKKKICTPAENDKNIAINMSPLPRAAGIKRKATQSLSLEELRGAVSQDRIINEGNIQGSDNKLQA
jgi:hypothetical protein